MSHDPYIDDGVEDLDDREAAGYFDDCPDCGNALGLCIRCFYEAERLTVAEHFDTREEANGER